MGCERGKIEGCDHFRIRYTSHQPPTTMSITTSQIQAHRAARKASGLTGCISGRPVPPMDFGGYKDVQSWRPSDPMKPHCFCFDCRDLWDNDASIDLQLLKDGYAAALSTYAELLLPQRTNGGGLLPPPLRVDTFLGSYDSFEEVPTSLPAPRHRDVMNETKEERLKKDLGELRATIQGDLVRAMDKRRCGVFYDEPERSEYLRSVDDQENKLWLKLDAVELLMNE